MPEFAIPLPNRYGSAESGASFVKADGEEFILSDAAQNYAEVLIAHTFVITEPGIYCMSSTYGTFAISYLSIDNVSEGETESGVAMGAQFSIDFCHGELALNGVPALAPENPDTNAALEDLAYVGSANWYHSNIFPSFTAGSRDNPSDNLFMNIKRVYDSESDTSTLKVTTNTEMWIAPGVLYSNSNNILQREERRVSFQVFCDGLGTEDVSNMPSIPILWTALTNDGETFRLFATSLEQGGSYLLMIKQGENSYKMLTILMTKPADKKHTARQMKVALLYVFA